MASLGDLRTVRADLSRPDWLNRRTGVVATLAVWLVLFGLLRGRDTLRLEQADVTSFHTWLDSVNDSVGANRGTNPLFVHFLDQVRAGIDAVATAMQSLLSQPVGDRPLPLLGWLGVVVLAGFGAWALAGVRVALLAVAGLAFIGTQGLWQPAMDTLALTLTAVFFCLVVGIPLGIWTGLSDRVNRVVTPVLDFMQTMPTFVYLAPLALLFRIGPASATIATLVYATPPVIRITAHGLRELPRETLEAATAIGSTRAQLLGKVMLPMAKRTIVLGINQTIMAALAMVTIAALIDAPGLGRVVLDALNRLDIGAAFNGGLAIVVLAIVMDRVTTATSMRAERARQRSAAPRFRRAGLLGGGVAAVVCAYLSYTYVWAAQFPSDPDLGGPIRTATAEVVGWVQANLGPTTGAVKDGVTAAVVDPLQSLLTQSPWWVTLAVVVVLAWVIGNWGAAVTAAVCLGLIVASGLWYDAMTTLAATLIGTAVVVVLGVVLGVWMGRSRGVDRVLRPVLDAAQTMPAFVYLVPFVALFGASRFTGIVAAVVYAAPVVLKIVADGIRAVPVVTVEAATSVGSSTWQIITKVQLPMSVRTLVLAANQGLCYVLSMVVVGGLVGAGALGFDVVSGFRQDRWFGKGVAAGCAIVLLGVLLDRITRAAASRSRG